jgi:hypothetical protein
MSEIVKVGKPAPVGLKFDPRASRSKFHPSYPSNNFVISHQSYYHLTDLLRLGQDKVLIPQT